jgi:hypothetical protein
MTATTEILDLVQRWAAAERHDDPGQPAGPPSR